MFFLTTSSSPISSHSLSCSSSGAFAFAMLSELSRLGDTLVATESTNARVLSADELARRAETTFARVETAADPVAAVRRAHELGGDVLVTGSLYLLADLAAAEAGEAA